MADKAFVVKNSLIVNTSLLVANNGKVGIGTATPDSTLTVVGTSKSTSGGGNIPAYYGISPGTGYKFAHSNINYYGSVGTLSGGGHPFVAFHAEHSTNPNTLKNSAAGVRGAYFLWEGTTLSFGINGSSVPDADFSGGVNAFTANTSGLSTANLYATSVIVNGSTIQNAAFKAIATANDIIANTADKVVTSDALNGVGAYVTLTDGATITPTLASGVNFTVTLGGNRTLANPTGLIVGRSGYIEVIQDGTGNHTLSFGTAYKFDTGVAPTIDLTAGHKSVLAYHVRSSSIVFLSMPYYGVQ